MADLLDMGAVELAQLVHGRQVSPVALVDAHIAQIEAVNPHLNALVADCFEAARLDAREAEARILATPASTRLPPLLGVPCTVSEGIAVQDLPQTAGIVHRWDEVATYDAVVVERLRDAGAVVLGVSNGPEAGLWMETHNLVYGRSNNPWHTDHTPGGSAGGEGALIGAGGSPFGIGCDVAGSVRMAGSFCGVASHKPTGRMVPSAGLYPRLEGDMGATVAISPLARRVADLAIVLDAIQGESPEDPLVRPWSMGAWDAVDLSKVRVMAVRRIGRVQAEGHNAKQIDRALELLRHGGAETQELVEPRFNEAFDIWSAMVADAAGPSFSQMLGSGQPIPLLKEVLRFPLGRANHTTPALASVFVEALRKTAQRDVSTLRAAGRALRHDLEARMGDSGVLLTPVYSRPAPRHRGSMLTPFDFVCTALFNVLEFPATVVPMAWVPTAEGTAMPIGIQVVARRGNDHLTLAVAHQLETALGGWRRAPPPAAPSVRR